MGAEDSHIQKVKDSGKGAANFILILKGALKPKKVETVD